MEFMITGLPLIILLVGSLVVYAAPVWLAAKIVAVRDATLLRCILSLLVATLLAGACLVASGPFALFLVPLSFLLAFMLVLRASFGQSFLLGVLALLGYALMFKLFGHLAITHFGSPGAQQV